MKSATPSIETSKRTRGEASTVAPAFDDQVVVEEIPIDPTVAVDHAIDGTVDLIVIPPLSLCAMMKTFMTTQAAH